MYRGRHATRSRATARWPAWPPHGLAPAGHGPAGALLRRHLRQPRHAAAARQLGLPGVRDQHAGCVGAYLVEHDLFDFLLLLAARQRHALAQARPARPGRRRSPPPTASSSGCSHAGGGTDAFLDEHAVIVMADHSHAAGRAQRRPARRLRGLARPRRRRRTARRGRDRGVPGAARGDGLRARSPRRRDALVPRARARGALALEGVDLVLWRPAPRRGRDRVGGAASCASPRAATCATRAAGAGASTATSSVLDARGRATACSPPPTTPTRWPAPGRR